MIVLLFILPMIMIGLGVYFFMQNRIPLQKEIGIAWSIGGIISILISIVLLRHVEKVEGILLVSIVQVLIFLLSILPIQIRFVFKHRK
ncbi:MAG: hypothetical protein KBT48_11410 [Firmicutes bacterium]|nr:hypothetical protein [Bacillota bacterium]